MRARDERDTRARARRPAAGRGRGRARHDGPRRRTRSSQRVVELARRAAGLGRERRRPTVAVVGFPNAGKSTLINRLAGGREAVTDAEPGVTRDRRALPCEWNGAALRPDRHRRAWTWPTPTSSPARSRHRRATAIEEADVILLVVDARAGLGPGDAELAETCCALARSRCWSPPTRSTGPGTRRWPPSCTRLGLGEPLPVSAIHGLGTGDLLDRITAELGGRRRRAADADRRRAAQDRDPRTAQRRQVLAAEQRCSAPSA